MVEKKEIMIAKEVDDVMVFIIELLKDIKEKKDVSALVAENLTNLINAIGGIDQMSDELKDEALFATIGYRLGEVAGIFLKKSA
jgi:hypothetical protein